jgi:hypothetical protein
MATLIYRVVSACGALGYGFPNESLDAAIKGGVDAIISDAGSMDAGPYYLRTGSQYFGRDAVKRDFSVIVQAAQRVGVPVILGSCGMAGGDRNLAWMLDVAKEVFAEQNVCGVKVATISAELDPEIVIAEFRKGALLPTGHGPELSEATLRESTIVGQMGIHPLITALNSGARYVFAGRACDAALFASDMIRRGVDAGTAYHVGHVLECGALACEPGSPSDCLVAEVYDDDSALFVAPNVGRRCTPYSIAAHALHEQSHPQLQFYPEGVLAMERTEFHARDSRTAAIRNSRFVRAAYPRPWSVKLEGARLLGKRKVSLIYIDPADLPRIPDDVLVYGRNGVQATPVQGPAERELGIIIETAANDPQAAILLASLLTRYLAHYGYPGRKATAGNIAYPMSPNLVSFQHDDGRYGAIVPSGTRDPVFLDNYASIKDAVIGQIEQEFPEALANATHTITGADADNPAILLRTVERDPQRLDALHRLEIARIATLAKPQAGSRLNLDAPDECAWSLHHLLQSESVIKQQMFPVTWYRAHGADWTLQGTQQPHYFDAGVTGYIGSVDDRTLSLIADAPPAGAPHGVQRLLDMAVVIRSKNAGINRLTFDIIFTSAETDETALRSNVFHKDNVACLLRLPAEHVVGTFFVDSCNAIKISVDRPNISASSDERDVFGAQQQAALEHLTIPLYAEPLLRASAV